MEKAVFDHIAVLCSDLSEGVEYVADQIGVRVPPGGEHPLMGTHNHLMRLGPSCFLEIIAPNPSAQPMRIPWFGLSDPPSTPKLACWVVGVSDIRSALTDLDSDYGEAVWVERGDLRWQISVPVDGSLPRAGQWPTLIQWPTGNHPASRMTDLGCRIQQVSVTGPAAHFGSVPGVVYEDSNTVNLSAQIDTPSGIRVLT